MDIPAQLRDLAHRIAHELDFSVLNETIHLCGLAPLRIIASEPNAVLKLANDKINASPYQHVPKYWRRLLEDASLHKVVRMLRTRAASLRGEIRLSQPDSMDLEYYRGDAQWLSDIVNVLDRVLVVGGAPGRKDLVDATLAQLGKCVVQDENCCVPATFMIASPPRLESQQLIARVPGSALSMEGFQTFLSDGAKPLIIPAVTDHWPAATKWCDPRYWIALTLGGRRMVPVEIGASYMNHDWRQEIMSFERFLTEYVLPVNPANIGYLAQHDLLWQFPQLKADIITPDYVYTVPPSATGAELQTAGLGSVKQLEDPLINAWLGPKGTKTPLHTDPYHNIYCQVVGYKYFRLYSPEERTKLYPVGTNDQGMPMDNTSSIDISLVRQPSLVEDVYRQYPLFEGARFVEGVLAPGECLYIPLGWWHYVEGLSTSFSVSFWWN